MTRTSYVQINGILYEKGTEPRTPSPGRAGPAVLSDLPDFVSPIDGKSYSGRAGLRNHCARHDVVPTADLAGLPTKLPVPKAPKGEIREKIIETMYRKGYIS